jgi:hypothetical protein
VFAPLTHQELGEKLLFGPKVVMAVPVCPQAAALITSPNNARNTVTPPIGGKPLPSNLATVI